MSRYILYFGQAFPRRHLKETMLAFEIVARRLPALRLIAVGHDRYNPPVIRKLQEAINERLGREAILYKEYVPEEERDALFSGAQARRKPWSISPPGKPLGCRLSRPWRTGPCPL